LTRTPDPGPGAPSLGAYWLLGRVHGAEKAFLSGRRDREKDLESSITFFLEFLRGFESFDFSDPCVAKPAKTPEEAVRLIRENGMRSV
jgi:hypothetical protein